MVTGCIVGDRCDGHGAVQVRVREVRLVTGSSLQGATRRAWWLPAKMTQ